MAADVEGGRSVRSITKQNKRLKKEKRKMQTQIRNEEINFLNSTVRNAKLNKVVLRSKIYLAASIALTAANVFFFMVTR